MFVCVSSTHLGQPFRELFHGPFTQPDSNPQCFGAAHTRPRKVSPQSWHPVYLAKSRHSPFSLLPLGYQPFGNPLGLAESPNTNGPERLSPSRWRGCAIGNYSARLMIGFGSSLLAKTATLQLGEGSDCLGPLSSDFVNRSGQFRFALQICSAEVSKLRCFSQFAAQAVTENKSGLQTGIVPILDSGRHQFGPGTESGADPDGILDSPGSVRLCCQVRGHILSHERGDRNLGASRVRSLPTRAGASATTARRVLLGIIHSTISPATIPRTADAAATPTRKWVAGCSCGRH